MTTINGVRIHPGFFKQRARKPVEHRVSDAPVSARLKPTSIPKPNAPRAKYAMPALAIIGAIGSFTAGAAIATAAGATLGAMVVGGAMMVGAALTVVGTVTGNQKLAKWGGILSIAGGIGALGLGAAGMLTSTAGEAAAGVGAAAADGVSGSIIGTDALAGNIADQAGGGIIDAAGSAAGDIAGSAAGSAAGGGAGGSSGMLTAADLAPVPTVAAEAAATPAVTSAVAPDVSPLPTSAPVAELPQIDTSMSSGMLGSSDLAPLPKIALEQPSMWKEFQSWYKTNPELAKTLTETVKGGLGAMPNDQTKAQTAYYQANTDLAKANTEKTQEETYRLWVKNFYNQGKMPPSGATPPPGRGG